MPDAELPEELLRTLSERIARVSGIHIPDSKRWLLSGRVHERMRAVGEADARRYLDAVLGADGAELGRLVEAVRVGETQFFRHKGQLRAIRRVALPEIVARRERESQKRVRVWSAGCATGEEPYTIAMLLEEALPSTDGWRHSVLATDLSETALEQARAARYPASAARTLPPSIAGFAVEAHGEDVVVTPRVRRTVRFERQNLLDAKYPQDFDLVLCRNVLIYFDRATQDDVLVRLAGSVCEGGYLALGYAERLSRHDPRLVPIRTDEGILYRRASAAEELRATPAPETVSGPPAPPPRTSRSSLDRLDPTPVARVSAPSVEPPAAPPSRPLPALEGVLEGDEGRAIARRVATEVVARSPAVLDLRGLRFADEAVARELERAAHAVASTGTPLVVIAAAPGIERFLRRHGVVPPAVLVREPPGER
jgi:chemotaxis protein methyltransferase CheR